MLQNVLIFQQLRMLLILFRNKKKSIWDGFVRGIEIPIERSIDIDNKYDFIAKFLFSKKLRYEFDQ